MDRKPRYLPTFPVSLALHLHLVHCAHRFLGRPLLFGRGALRGYLISREMTYLRASYRHSKPS